MERSRELRVMRHPVGERFDPRLKPGNLSGLIRHEPRPSRKAPGKLFGFSNFGFCGRPRRGGGAQVFDQGGFRTFGQLSWIEAERASKVVENSTPDSAPVMLNEVKIGRRNSRGPRQIRLPHRGIKPTFADSRACQSSLGHILESFSDCFPVFSAIAGKYLYTLQLPSVYVFTNFLFLLRHLL